MLFVRRILSMTLRIQNQLLGSSPGEFGPGLPARPSTRSLYIDLALIHRQHKLIALLWETIQEHIINPRRLKSGNAYEIERIQGSSQVSYGACCGATGSTGEESRRSEPEHPGTPQDSRVRELLGKASNPLRRKKEREHFLGRGNPRRPSKN